MMMWTRVKTVAAAIALGGAIVASDGAAADKPMATPPATKPAGGAAVKPSAPVTPPGDTARTVVLGVDTVGGPEMTPAGGWIVPGPNNAWRYLEVWQSDFCRTEKGDLIRVDPYAFSHDKCPGWRHKPGTSISLDPTTNIQGSTLAPAGWQSPDFDDSGWVRRFAPFKNLYRSLAMICLRGKFEVKDAAALQDMDLTVRYQGGVAVYMRCGRNGQAITLAGCMTRWKPCPPRKFRS